MDKMQFVTPSARWLKLLHLEASFKYMEGRTNSLVQTVFDFADRVRGLHVPCLHETVQSVNGRSDIKSRLALGMAVG